MIAARLAPAGARVVALEAGPDPGPHGSARWPEDLLDGDRVGSSHDWGYDGPAADGRTLPFPRARVVGGCSAHNGCTQSIGWRGDWDDWGAASAGWSSGDVLPHVERAAKQLRIRQPARAELQPLQLRFLDAATAAGIEHRDDLLDLDGGAGVAISPVNSPDEVRWNTAFAYLDPLRASPSLSIHGDAHVERIELAGDRAVAVIALVRGQRQRIRTDRVILCAGAYGTPEVLLRSGIGPADHLRSLGIPVVADLPGVGANLHDHPTALRSFEATPELARELDRAGRVPDEQVLAKLSSGRDAHAAPYDLHLFPWTERDPESPTGWRVQIPVALLRPGSRGTVRLRSRDPLVRAQLDHGFLRDPEDAARLARGLEAIETLLARLPLGRELSEAPNGDLVAWLGRNHEHYWHPVGTCAMGEHPGAVVDERARVHGIENVQVADASVFPVAPRATTAFPVVLVAERIAELALRSGLT